MDAEKGELQGNRVADTEMDLQRTNPAGFLCFMHLHVLADEIDDSRENTH